MKRLIRRVATAVVFSGVVACVAPATADDGHVAIFKNVTGPMKIVRQDQTIDAQPGSPVFANDRVVSGTNGSAGIVFKDGTLVTVGASSDVRIRDYAFETAESKFAFSMYLAKGSAIYSSGKIGKLAPEAVKIETPTTTVGVRGTRFIVTAEEPTP